MKVKELISKLKTLDQNLDVLCYTEDESFLPKGHAFRILEIEAVEVEDCEKMKGDDQVPTLKIGKGSLSEKNVLINVTSEF